MNAPLEVIDPEIADIIELEKARQWKVLIYSIASLDGLKMSELYVMIVNSNFECVGT